MTAEFHTLPVWKKGSTAAEWLDELAGLAREHPHKWARIVVVFEELDAEGNATHTRQHVRNCPNNTTVIGTLQTSILETFEYMKDRRSET